MSDSQVNIHIGSVEEMGARFVEAWHAAERGEAVARDHVTFLSLESFVSAMSPKRLALIQYLRRAGAMSVRKLAGSIGRDYKSVHSDVALLVAAGLIAREAKDQVAVHWDHVQADMRLAA
jgi:predicted transcriptional regulator